MEWSKILIYNHLYSKQELWGGGGGGVWWWWGGGDVASIINMDQV